MKNNGFELNDKTMAEVVGGQNTDGEKGSGFRCPNCGKWITVTIYDILSSDSVTCTSCSYVLPIDKSKSNSAIDALRKVKEAQEKLKNK